MSRRYCGIDDTRARSEVRERVTTQFPVYEHAGLPAASAGLDLRLRTGPDGALVELDVRPRPAQVRRNEPAAAPPATGPLAALVLDLGANARHEVLQALRFQSADAKSDYHARLAIERSDDLKLWDGVAHGTLDWISASDQSAQLVNDRIALPPGSGRYLKLRWVDGQPQDFAAIFGEWRGVTATPEPRLELSLPAEPGRVDGDFIYRTSPSIAASSVGLDLPEPNTVLPVMIGCYREQRVAKPQWLLQAQISSTFCRLNRDGDERRSSRIQVTPLANAEWVLRPHLATLAPPHLVLGWQPQTLVFTARGSGLPLAVGAEPEVIRHWRGGATTLAQVAPGFSASEIAQLQRVQIGKPSRSLAAVAAVAVAAPSAAANAAARQRRLVLWAVLGVGLLVLGWMSWRLYAQLGAGRSA